MEKMLHNRKFKFGFYHVTHGEAIIRSVKTEEFGTNIDIYFGDIQYIEIPTKLSELKLENANETDIVCHYENDCGIQQNALNSGKIFEGGMIGLSFSIQRKK